MTLLEDLQGKLQETISRAAREAGLDLVEFKMAHSKSGFRLFIYVDRRGGVQIAECARLSRRLQGDISLEDFFHGDNFFLEVSSPGAERPLVKADDFKRNVGKKLIFSLKPENGQAQESEPVTVEGQLVDITENQLIVDNQEGRQTMPLERVAKARIKLPF